MIAHESFRTKLTNFIDPANEVATKFKLSAIPRGLPPKQRLRGKIVDENGAPVFGALVSIQGALQGDRNWHGRVINVDKAAVTGVDGTFLLTSKDVYEAWRLTVNATGFVELDTELLATGDTEHQLSLDPGCSVGGTIVKDGKPAAGVTVGICQTNRGSNQFVGEYVIKTDESGNFLFNSVVPGNKMTIYTKMEKGNRLATELVEFSTEKSGTSTELGEFDLRPTKTITGKLMLLGGKPIPKNFRIYVGREFAWDSQIIDVDPKGHFQIDGIPENESINISVRIKSYVIDSSVTNFQLTGPSKIALFSEKDLDHVEIFLKPENK